MLIVSSLHAQITLEATFDTETMVATELDGDSSTIFLFIDSNEIAFVDSNMQSIKTLQMPIPARLANHVPFIATHIIHVSQRAFDPNEELEIAVAFKAYDSLSGYNTFIVRVFTETGNTILDVEDVIFNTYWSMVEPSRVVQPYGSRPIFIVNCSTTPHNEEDKFIKVYSLPGYLNKPVGILERIGDPGNGTGLGNAYPNPSNGEVNIPFELENNDSGTLTLIDLNGKVIYEEPVSSAFNNLHFDAGQLASGSYIYTLTIDNQVVESKKLVVN